MGPGLHQCDSVDVDSLLSDEVAVFLGKKNYEHV